MENFGQSTVISLDAPVGGWDAYNSIDNMPPTNAVLLDNLIPSTGRVTSRLGQEEYCDIGTGTPVETLASFQAPLEDRLFAATNNEIWDITDPALPVVSTQPAPITSDRWQTHNFEGTDPSGLTARLIWCNGVDDARTFKQGGGWEVLADTNGVGVDFEGGVSYKGRMYYWKARRNRFWYATEGAFQGDLQEFNLGSFNTQGGHIEYITTWTQMDAGDGRDDFIVFVFNTGEVLVYQGDSPTVGQYWEIVGRYKMSEPLGPRSNVSFGTDRILMTKDGYQSLSTITQQGRIGDQNQFGRQIYGAVASKARAFSTLFGWEATHWPRGGLVLFNVPLSEDSFEQHVLNLVTMRWCRFTGYETATMVVHRERLYGSTRDGRVLELMVGTSDEGEAIQCKCIMAYNDFGNLGYNKHLTAAELLTTIQRAQNIIIDGLDRYSIPFLPDVQSDEDFKRLGKWADPPVPGVDGSPWNRDFWARQGAVPTTSGWQNVSAFGNAVSLAVRFAVVNEIADWRSTSVRIHFSGAQ